MRTKLSQVGFEIEPSAEFRPASPDEIAGRVREAAAPAVEAAQAVLERVREAAPEDVKVKFGVKVSGTANWFVAKASTEGNFEIELTWKREHPQPAIGSLTGGDTP
jgi:Trypsin-co-occurring domain 1